MTMHPCDLCGGVDEAPRHVHAHGEGSAAPAARRHVLTAVLAAGLPPDVTADAIEALNDPSLEIRHLDCCAASGTCPDGTCATIHAATPVADVTAGQALTVDDGVLRDEQLRAFILTGAVDHVGAQATQGV